jgi:hypothetical protein
MSKTASAQIGAYKRRLFLTTIPNGIVPSDWFPTDSEAGLTLPRTFEALSEFELPGLVEFQQDLLIFSGIENVAVSQGIERSHNEGMYSQFTASFFSGTEGDSGSWRVSSPSVDQVISEALQQSEGTKAFKTLGIVPGHSFNQALSYDRMGNWNGFSQPQDLFAQVFGTAQLPVEERERIRSRKLSILDSVSQTYLELQSQLGVADQARLQAHLDALREVETRVAVEVSCQAPNASDYMNPERGSNGPNMLKWASLMQDLMVLAMACDLTACASLSYRPCGGGGSYFPWLGLPDAAGLEGSLADTAYQEGEHHEMSHRVELPEWAPILTTIAQWYCGLTARLVKRLKETPDGDGSLFDSAIILQASEVATGLHNFDNMPFLLIGKSSDNLRTGRHVQFEAGTPHNRLLQSLMELMNTPVVPIGDPDLASGPLTGLS